MKFTELKLKGAFIIELDEHQDERGTFARHFCRNELLKYNIDFNICQCNISKNTYKNTIRGMHYQAAPYQEPKMVSCLKGKLYDVIVDLRKDSSTYLKWQGIELSENDNQILYIPSDFAHGFQTLQDDTNILYYMGNYFNPESGRGLRYNDSKIGIEWKNFDYEPIMSEKDRNYSLI